MPYIVYRSDGLPLREFEALRVYRDGWFTMAYQPMVRDVFTLVTDLESVSYCVYAVEGFKAFVVLSCTNDNS